MAASERSHGFWPQQHQLPLATASRLRRAETAAQNDGRPARRDAAARTG